MATIGAEQIYHQRLTTLLLTNLGTMFRGKIPGMIQTPLEFPTPNLDLIPDVRWLLTRYDMFQIAETNMLISNRIWITAKRKRIPVTAMTAQHIRNCINCFNGIGKARIPSHYLGGKSKWLPIFHQELLNRQ